MVERKSHTINCLDTIIRLAIIASGKAYIFKDMARMVEGIIPGPQITVGMAH